MADPKAEVPKKKPGVRRPGFHSVLIHIPDAAWSNIQTYIDNKTLDETKFLTKHMADWAETLKA
jgi:hypothetical protein